MKSINLERAVGNFFHESSFWRFYILSLNLQRGALKVSAKNEGASSES